MNRLATTMSQPDRQLERFGNYWGESLIVNETAIMDDIEFGCRLACDAASWGGSR